MKYFFSIMFFLGSSTILAEETKEYVQQEQAQTETKVTPVVTEAEENK
jgi:hypothetical protein